MRIYSLGEAARLLGVPSHRLTYTHTSGKVPEPERVLGKRAYRAEDIRALAVHFGIEMDGLKLENDLKEATDD